jgi:hypothetical protein
MHRVVELFAPELKKIEFFSEWSLHVEKGLDVGVMVNTFMEQLRTTDEAPRQAFTLLLAYMLPRPWSEFLESIKGSLGPEDIERFQKPGAEAFYNKLRMLSSLQVEDYWKQFYAQKQVEAQEVGDAVDKLPPGVFETRVRSIVLPLISEQADAQTVHIVEVLKKEIKKMIDAQAEGDEWKKNREKDEDDSRKSEGEMEP